MQCDIQNFGLEGDDRSKKPGFWIVRSEGVNSGICIGVARSCDVFDFKHFDCGFVNSLFVCLFFFFPFIL